MQDEQLVVAAQRGDLAKVKNLLKYVDPNSPKIDEDGKITYALHQAASKGQDEIVRVLIASGADVNLKQKDVLSKYSRSTALHRAVRYEHLSTVRILVSSGASPSISRGTSSFGELTATFEALFSFVKYTGSKDVVQAIFKYLIKSGGTPDFLFEGKPARKVSAKNGWTIPDHYE